jgi:hypothetical protein
MKRKKVMGKRLKIEEDIIQQKVIIFLAMLQCKARVPHPKSSPQETLMVL